MPPLRGKAAGAAGFTLIEALVALVILSAGLLVFYEFLATSLRAADRVRHAAAAYDRERNALALASTLNPMAAPDGSFDLGPYRIHWHAERLTSPRRSTSFPLAGQGQFTIALYRVVLDFPDNREFAPVATTKLGYHRETAPATDSNL